MKQTQRDRKVRQVILIEGAANLTVLLAKVVVGFSTGSLAVLSDAVHSLTDMFNNIVAWTVVRLSAVPADREHPYGHRKFETLAVFGLAALLVVLAFELGLNAIKGESKTIASSAWELGVMLAVLIINIVVATWQRRWARRLESDILLADASHTFADVMVTLMVIAGWQLSVMGYVWLDRLCALGVAGLVLYLAYQLFKRAVPVLVDQFAVDPEQLTRAVMTVSGVREVRRIRSRWVGSEPVVDMIISVDPALTTEQSHNISDQIELLLEQQFHINDISIHVEPANDKPS
jgi:cation diffusion facilitator family transporter